MQHHIQGKWDAQFPDQPGRRHLREVRRGAGHFVAQPRLVRLKADLDGIKPGVDELPAPGPWSTPVRS